MSTTNLPTQPTYQYVAKITNDRDLITYRNIKVVITETINNLSFEDFEKQAQKGLSKYGQLIDDAELTIEELEQHAKEELVDFITYQFRIAVIKSKK